MDFILYHPDGMVPYYTGYIPSGSNIASYITSGLQPVLNEVIV